MHPTTAAIYGLKPSPIPHWEHWSCPDAETYLTGIDYYDHPRACRQRLAELYPQLALGVPETDDPKPRPRMDGQGVSSDPDRHTVRWGDGETGSFEHGEVIFHSPEEVFKFSPLAQGDFTKFPIVECRDYSDEQKLYEMYRKNYPADWGDRPPADSTTFDCVGFYNTTFMWPMLTFGWELFLECCLDPRFERIMDEFAEINRRVFRAFARLPIRFVTCHDDIVMSRGPVCSPAWMRKYVFPRYEEYWDILKAGGVEVIFMTDGCADVFVDDVMACGAKGFVSEPYTDYRGIARRYENCVLAGEGDNRILSGNDPAAIRGMVEQMVQTGRMSGGYFMCIGNHIPWNVPGEAIKLYLDLSAELAHR